jgi:hypothetical protein
MKPWKINFPCGLELWDDDIPVNGVCPIHKGDCESNLKPKGERSMGEKIELGCKVKESITGFVGTVTARCVYLDDDPRLLVEAVDTTGRPIEHWIKESRAEVQG